MHCDTATTTTAIVYNLAYNACTYTVTPYYILYATAPAEMQTSDNEVSISDSASSQPQPGVASRVDYVWHTMAHGWANALLCAQVRNDVVCTSFRWQNTRTDTTQNIFILRRLLSMRFSASSVVPVVSVAIAKCIMQMYEIADLRRNLAAPKRKARSIKWDIYALRRGISFQPRIRFAPTWHPLNPVSVRRRRRLRARSTHFFGINFL